MTDLQIETSKEIEQSIKGLETLLTEQMNKKIEGTFEQDQIEFELNRLSENFDRLKDIHVRSYENTCKSKQATADAKEIMNAKQVELQGFMYEKRHILEEIVQCREFRSVYQYVELIPLDEFKSRAGPEFLEDLNNSHQLMINRLKYELLLRSELKEREEALQLKKAQLIKENRKVQQKMDQFDKLLDDFVQSATPLEEALAAESTVPDNNDNSRESMELDQHNEMNHSMENGNNATSITIVDSMDTT